MSRKSIIIRFLLILAVLLYWWIFGNYINALDRKNARPHKFIFDTSSLESVRKKYKLSAAPAIQRVILAGRFTDWNPDSTVYTMRRSGRSNWIYSHSLPQGRHSYKYVVYLKYPQKYPAIPGGRVWCPDSKALHHEEDGFGGKNSVLIRRDTRPLKKFRNYSLLFLLGGILILTMMELVLRLLMYIRLSLKYKLLAIFLFISAVTIASIIVVLHQQKITLAKKTMVDKINMIHSMLLGEGIRFDMVDKKESSRIEHFLQKFLKGTSTRFSYNEFSNNKQQIDNIFLLDRDGRVLAYGVGKSAIDYLSKIRSGSRHPARLYRNILQHLHRWYTTHNTVKKDIIAIYWNDILPAALRTTPGTDSKISFFRYDTFIYPVFNKRKPIGYYVVQANPQSYSELLGDLFYFNLLVGIFILTIVAFLTIKIGHQILMPINHLIEGITRIKTGDLGFPFSIKTNDEFDRLGLAYNYMRLGLIEANAIKDQLLLKSERKAENLADIISLRQEIRPLIRDGKLVYKSKKMESVLDSVRQAAPLNQPVLITGETGTGKELIARLVHDRGSGNAAPFVAINCSAIPADLLEDEIFGHVRGAFTDAQQDRPGRITEAADGILFFDEIGEMAPALQAKLLRVLQEREYRQIGGTEVLKVRCRFLFATNRNLETMVEENQFRKDLFYRISVLTVELPPLRERREDIIGLIHHYLDSYATEMGMQIPDIEQKALDAMAMYNWPGNVRELENVIIKTLAVLRDVPAGQQVVLRLNDLPFAFQNSVAPSGTISVSKSSKSHPDTDSLDFQKMVNIYMRELITTAIQQSGGNRTKAARLLGMKRGSLLYRMRELGIE